MAERGHISTQSRQPEHSLAENAGRYGAGRSALVGQVITHRPHAVQESSIMTLKLGEDGFRSLTVVVMATLSSLRSLLVAISTRGIRPATREGRGRRTDYDQRFHIHLISVEVLELDNLHRLVVPPHCFGYHYGCGWWPK